MKICQDCKKPCRGLKCRSCYTKNSQVRNPERCLACGKQLNRGSGLATGKCRDCLWGRTKAIISDECDVAPALSAIPKEEDVECIVLTDLHIPYHDSTVIQKACRTAQILNIDHLIVAGDLVHADLLSRFFNCGTSPSAFDELESAGRIVQALLNVFKRITIIPGNHDQRWERAFSKLKGQEAVAAMDVIRGLTGSKDTSGESLALGVFRQVLSSPRVTMHPLPEMIVGRDPGWRIQHPATCSRTPAATERKMASKHLQHILSGHNHLAGWSLHESGKFICGNLGHACDHEKFRYVRESPTHFPKTVPGYCAIYKTKDSPGGKVLPIVVHDSWFDVESLAERLQSADQT